MRRLVCVLALIVLGASGCSCEGPKGDTGPEGPQGPQGPLADPPKIFAVSPDSGSWRNLITITGENYVAGSNEVYFDGSLATIVSETATEIVVEPTGIYLDPSDPGQVVDITVIAGQQASNAFAFDALPSGFPRDFPAAYISQVADVATDGTLIYVADHGSGVVTVDPGKAYGTGLLRGLGDGMKKPDAAAYHATYGVLIASDESDLADGTVHQLLGIDPATGNAQVLIGQAFGLALVVDIVVDSANGDIYVIQEDTDNTKPIARLSDTLGFEPNWGEVNAATTVTSAAVVGANLYVGATAGIYELVAGDAGGGSVNVIKGLDVATTPQAMDANGNQLVVIDGNDILDIANLGMNPSNVTTFSNFSVANPGRNLVNVGGEYYYSGLDTVGTDNALLLATDADTQIVVSASPGYMGLFDMRAASNGDIYMGSLVACSIGGLTANQLHRLSPSGTVELVGSGSCAYRTDVLSTGVIATADLFNVAINTIDPATGTPTTILDAADGLEQPFSVFVGANDTLYFGHVMGGVAYLGQADANGGNLDLTFVDLTTASIIPTDGGILGNTLVFTQVGAPQLHSVDLGTGALSLDYVDSNQLPGLLYGLQATPDGTLVAAFFDGDNVGGAVEILPTGVVWPLFQSDPNQGPSLPLGMAVMPSRDLLMMDLGTASIVAGDPIVVTP